MNGPASGLLLKLGHAPDLCSVCKGFLVQCFHSTVLSAGALRAERQTDQPVDAPIPPRDEVLIQWCLIL